jgi:glycosyltransferase involved in cell wall biosynthesis
MSKIGVVTIGRNEGERLIRCLQSILAQLPPEGIVVYVDSGSTDQSCPAARELGVEVVELDMSIPFTASRARNAGFQRLQEKDPAVEYVQFIDGDSELVTGWIAAALAEFENNPQSIAAVCGWRKERHPEHSIYNRITEIEGQMAGKMKGQVMSFEGSVVIRADTFVAVGGYNDNVIAAEDDELSVRVRQAGGIIWRLDRQSIIHDADMYNLWQWWRRSKRTGYAYAQVSSLHGTPPERKFVVEIRRTWLWGAIIPLSALILAPVTYGWSLIAFLRYLVTPIRLFYHTKRYNFSPLSRWVWALSCTMGAFPGVLGAMKFYGDRWCHKRPEIIEYK